MFDAPSLKWLGELEFQFYFRQAVWTFKRWVRIARPQSRVHERCDVEQAWDVRYKRRAALDACYYAAAALLMTRILAGQARLDAHLWFELWRRPNAKCVWAVSNLVTKPLAKQLATLDWEEPARCESAGWSGRFVEQLPRDELVLLDASQGPYELPAPWNDPGFTPLPLHRVLEGTPGPSLYTSAVNRRPYSAWVELSVMKQV